MQEKARAAWEAQYGPVDPNTGRRRYQPDVGRGPRGGAVGAGGRSPGVDVGEHLYARARDQAARWKAREDAERWAAEEEAARSKINRGSRLQPPWAQHTARTWGAARSLKGPMGWCNHAHQVDACTMTAAVRYLH